MALVTCFYSNNGTKTPDIGPLVDSGAPYSGIGLVELKVLADYIGFSQNPKLDYILLALNGHTHMQYG